MRLRRLTSTWLRKHPNLGPHLEQLRAIINAAAPDCTDRVSYKVPMFRLKKDFVALSVAKSHCGPHA